MDDIFIIQLANRAKVEEGFLDKLPEDIRKLVEQKMQEGE